MKVEQENLTLKQKLVSIEDKLLENNLIISGVEESKLEEAGPQHENLTLYSQRYYLGKQKKKSWKRQKNLR